MHDVGAAVGRRTVLDTTCVMSDKMPPAIEPSLSEYPRISACIITFNEADRIQDCLESLDFCDEIIVEDLFSTDATVALASAAGAKVLQREFTGYRSQKAFCIEQAQYDWILSLDADERVSNTLKQSILDARKQNFSGAAGYRFARLSEYFGVFLRHGRTYPAHVLRLFDRRRGGWRGQREVHESVSVDGAVRTLKGDLIHYPYRNFLQLLDKKQKYARMMAEYDFSVGKRASLGKLLLAPIWRFWRGWLLYGGFLDGWPGLIESMTSANYVRQRTMMLWLLQNQQPLH